MIRNIFQLFVLVILISTIQGCTKEVTPTLTYPKTYRFNSPNLNQKSIYRLDTLRISGVLNYTHHLITDDYGSFDRSNQEIGDTINFMIRQNFASYMLSEVTLISSSLLELAQGYLDLKDNPDDDVVFVTDRDTFPYSMVGNLITPINANFDNGFRELTFCHVFIYANYKDKDGLTQYTYKQMPCDTPDELEILKKLVVLDKSIKYDTVSLEFIDYIYTSY